MFLPNFRYLCCLHILVSITYCVVFIFVCLSSSCVLCIVVSNTCCVMFFICLSSSCVLCMVVSNTCYVVLCVWFAFVLCLVYQMLPVSLECSLLITSSVSLMFIVNINYAFSYSILKKDWYLCAINKNGHIWFSVHKEFL
jgi:hypothetical protein